MCPPIVSIGLAFDDSENLVVGCIAVVRAAKLWDLFVPFQWPIRTEDVGSSEDIIWVKNRGVMVMVEELLPLGAEDQSTVMTARAVDVPEG